MLLFFWRRALVGRELGVGWHVQALVGTTADIRWSVFVRAEGSLHLAWHGYTSAQGSITLIWDVVHFEPSIYRKHAVLTHHKSLEATRSAVLQGVSTGQPMRSAVQTLTPTMSPTRSMVERDNSLGRARRQMQLANRVRTPREPRTMDDE